MSLSPSMRVLRSSSEVYAHTIECACVPRMGTPNAFPAATLEVASQPPIKA